MKIQSDFLMVPYSRVGYAVSSILFQRGIYPPDMFSQEQKYGMILLVPNDEDLNNYLNPIFSQVQSESLYSVECRVLLGYLSLRSYFRPLSYFS